MSERDELRALIYDYCERSSVWDDVATEAANEILASDWLAKHDAAIWDEGWNAAVDSNGFPGDRNPHRIEDPS